MSVLHEKMKPEIGEMVISLDFELLWGVRDHSTRNGYGKNIIGARAAIPQMLALFEKYNVACTWATVGLLFARSRSELLDMLPDISSRPRYTKRFLSNYLYLDELGANEKEDPWYFAPTLISRIVDTPRQEIATHTLTHAYALEDGMTTEAFRADIDRAVEVARDRGIDIRSIVFPRNQYSQTILDECLQAGLRYFRGNRAGWLYRPRRVESETQAFRALRLADTLALVTPGALYEPDEMSAGNRPASAFLRFPGGPANAALQLHYARVKQLMTAAAKSGRGIHLWCHPHNLGADVSMSISMLERILVHFRSLSDKYGMISNSMSAA